LSHISHPFPVAAEFFDVKSQSLGAAAIVKRADGMMEEMLCSNKRVKSKLPVS
jgi:hypothetical protein